MVRILSQNEIILNALDFYRLSQPSLDTKFGTVSRDLLVDGPSTQMAVLYQELSRIKTSQSLRLSLGQDLDKLAQNYGATRKRGSVSNGTAILTFNAIDADIPINKGDLVTANNGATFTVTTGLTISSVFANTYRATASKYMADLDFVGITDQYAAEVSVEATAPGSFGDISKYALVSTSIPGVSNITNALSFGGGTNAETDAQFRGRILSIFSGANTGTSLGYSNAVLADSAALDAVVVGPGDPLMTRDGTQVVVSDGQNIIVSEGTGGKVDIYIYGLRIVQVLDSYIYRDKSNQNDPSNSKNDFVLGQIAADADKTVTTKRLDNLASRILPAQPVNNILQVSGSSSGIFAEKQTDSLGRVTGNYELIRDTGAYGGSPWGFDRLHWIDNKIAGFSEDQTRGRFNGQDSLTFSDALKITGATQNIQISNENSRVSPSNRTSIQLAHYPVTNVSRVFNLTTGERYVVSSQNPDGTGSLNNTGRILIRGNTLPSTSDTLQVDYTWVFNYDSTIDFDNLVNDNNPRNSDDSIDWGFSNAVRREQQQITADGAQKQVLVTHPISTVISVNTFITNIGTVSLISGRLAVVVSTAVSNVISVIRTSDGSELYDTSKQDGSFNAFTIFFPTDSVVQFGDMVTVTYNANDIFTIDGLSGSFSSNLITLPDTVTSIVGTTVECNYIANVKVLLPSTVLASLPAVRNENTFNTQAATAIGVQPTTHIFSSPGVIEYNLRQAPSVLQLTISGSISPGVITVLGTTFSVVVDAVFTVSSSGLTHDLSTVIKSFLGLKSSDSVPTNVDVVRIISVEKVQTNSSFDVLAVETTYDIKSYQIRNNSFFKSEAVDNSSLSRTQFILPATSNNIDNAPVTGNRLRVTFYISTTNDSENVSFSKSGVLYTNKIYALVDSISKSSGFTSPASQTAALIVSNQNQPASGSRYSVIYNYLAPKTNERITINYNQNKLIADSALNIETVRPIGADVLPKDSIPILVNASLSVVVQRGFENSKTIVQQNVQDTITNTLNSTSLGTIIDSSDLINACYAVDGVDRARVTYFNINGVAGSVLSIEAKKNEYIKANIVTITIEDR